jgi:hypothetical protein
MTAWVADYTHRIAPAALKTAGVVGVCRYLAASTTIGKIIGKAEYDELRAASLDVVLNWEQAATDWLGGAAAGKAHGTKAAQLAHALGYPAGRPIPGSADFDMTAAQWSASGHAYAVAFRDALHAGGYAAGVYGPWDVLTWCQQLGGFGMFWQSMSTAFSAGRNRTVWPGAHLIQHFGSVTVAGQDVDRNTIGRADWAGGEEDDMLTEQQAKDVLYQTEHVPAVTVAGGRVSYSSTNRTVVTASADAAGKALTALQGQVDDLGNRIDGLAVTGSPTQDQVNAGMLNALQDPAVIAALGAAIAGHIHIQ